EVSLTLTMWLVVSCVFSFAFGLMSFKAPFSKRVSINICTPIVLTLLIVILPGIFAADKSELLWRLIAIPAALGCGIVAAFLAEIPITILKRRERIQRMSKD